MMTKPELQRRRIMKYNRNEKEKRTLLSILPRAAVPGIERMPNVIWPKVTAIKEKLIGLLRERLRRQ